MVTTICLISIILILIVCLIIIVFLLKRRQDIILAYNKYKEQRSLQQISPHLLPVQPYSRSTAEEEATKRLEQKQFIEIKRLLKEHKNLRIIEEKIKGWKKQGYNVDELEKMIEEMK